MCWQTLHNLSLFLYIIKKIIKFRIDPLSLIVMGKGLSFFVLFGSATPVILATLLRNIHWNRGRAFPSDVTCWQTGQSPSWRFDFPFVFGQDDADCPDTSVLQLSSSVTRYTTDLNARSKFRYPLV